MNMDSMMLSAKGAGTKGQRGTVFVVHPEHDSLLAMFNPEGVSVIINAAELEINGRITVDGMNAEDSSGAGAGGSILINAGHITGAEKITAKGGSENEIAYAGGGGGLRYMLNL